MKPNLVQLLHHAVLISIIIRSTYITRQWFEKIVIWIV